MCGIIGAVNFDGSPVNKLVREQFTKQHQRGTDGFGLFDTDRGHLVRSASGAKVFKYLNQVPVSNMLFHHRFPTSMDNIKRACHPFSTKDFFDTNYLLVHNGHISNAYELKDEHEAMGITYTSEHPDGEFNDSEALLWDVALYLQGQQPKIKAEGAVAFICLALRPGRKHDKLYFGRNTNPLNMSISKSGIMLASEGEGEAIERDVLYEFNYKTGKLKTKKLEFPTYYQSYADGRYGHSDDEFEELGYKMGKDGVWRMRTDGAGTEFVEGDEDELEEAMLMDAVYKMLLDPQLTDEGVKRDVTLVRNRYMWKAKGLFVNANRFLDDDLDALLDASVLLDGEWAGRRLEYTLSIYEKAGKHIYDDPLYTHSNSEDKAYSVDIHNAGLSQWADNFLQNPTNHLVVERGGK